jgi:hypothetical protein
MAELRTVDDDYFDAWQDAGEQALAILSEDCEHVPSFEVLAYGLEAVRSRSKAPIDVRRYARTVADNYQAQPVTPLVVGCGHTKVSVGRTARTSAVIWACPACDFTGGWPNVYER